MKITVIMAAYNSQVTIGPAISSFLNQSYSDKELLVIDGASRDATCEIVKGFASPEISVLSEPDTGIYDALNKGIAKARGDVIGILHTDDLFAHSAVLDRVAEAFHRGDIDGVYGDLEYVAKDDPARVIRYWQSEPYHPALLKRGWMPPHPTLFLRREVFERHGAYDTSFRIAADYDAMLRWLTKGQLRLAHIPEVLVKMRVGGESNRSLSRILTKSAEDYRALRRNGVGGIGTLVAKNLSKLPQFLRRVGG
ncbi:glycosyltransferase family 2 protein [Pseudotabrizicola sp. 4114]|uniref:glycosyltransferase family 2 protein n=1 Tax=Pseudotabrizicola sp. 4114 TaxID=2817731 RepID=UPI0028547CBE|nr:glycosyltransferase [Pseudorhodobacter sp. 4114]